MKPNKRTVFQAIPYQPHLNHYIPFSLSQQLERIHLYNHQPHYHSISASQLITQIQKVNHPCPSLTPALSSDLSHPLEFLPFSLSILGLFISICIYPTHPHKQDVTQGHCQYMLALIKSWGPPIFTQPRLIIDCLPFRVQLCI